MSPASPNRSLIVPSLGVAVGGLFPLAARIHGEFVGAAALISLAYLGVRTIPGPPWTRWLKEAASAAGLIFFLRFSEAAFISRSLTPPARGAYGMQYGFILVGVFSLGVLGRRLWHRHGANRPKTVSRAA